MPTTFEDLQQTYVSSPAELFATLDKLAPAEAYDLLLANVNRGLRANHLEEEEDEIKLPREFRRTSTRWSYYGYLLRWFEGAQLARYLHPHLELNIKGSTHLRDALATLVWKSISDDDSTGGVDDDLTEFEADAEAEHELTSGAADAAFIAADGEGEPQITDEEEDADGAGGTLAGLTRAQRRAAKKERRAKAKGA